MASIYKCNTQNSRELCYKYKTFDENKKRENCTVWGDLGHRVTTEVAVDRKARKKLT